MFKNNERKEVFGLRKYKGYGLAGAVIGAFMLGLGGTAHAKVVDNNDGTTTISNKSASITLETDHVRFNEDQKFTERKTVQDAHDVITETGKVKYRYETTDGQLIEESNVKDSGVTKQIDATYDVIGRSGKLYKNLTVTKTGDLDLEAGSKSTINKDGKTYRRVGEPVKIKDGGEVSPTQFNDVSVNANSEGLLTDTGKINHSNVKTGGRTWILQETPDGFSKYVMVQTPDTTSDDWTVQTFKAGEHNAKVFNQQHVTADGGIQEGDYIFVLEKNDYATIGQSIENYTSVMTLSLKDTYNIKDNIDINDFKTIAERLYTLVGEVRQGKRAPYKYTKHFADSYERYLTLANQTDGFESFVHFLTVVDTEDGDTFGYSAVNNSFVEYLKNVSNVAVEDGKPISDYWISNDDITSREFWNSLSITIREFNTDAFADRWSTDDLEKLNIINEDWKSRDAAKYSKLPELFDKYGNDNSDIPYLLGSNGSAVTHNKETYRYHSTYTPLRAYKIGPTETTIAYRYEEVKKGSVVTNYYIENTTTNLADSISQSDLEVGTKYQTQPATIAPKVETEELPDRTVTRHIRYELIKTPDNASGNIIEGETIVNYYYRPITTEDVAMKEFKDIVTSHSETRYDVQHVFDAELEKDVKGFDDNNSIFLNQKYGAKTEISRRIYDAALGFGEKKGVYPPLSKIREAENNFAKMLGYESREDYLKHNKDAIFDLTKLPLFQYDNTYSTIQSDLTTGFTTLAGDLADFRTRGSFGDLDVFENIDTNVFNEYESRLPDGAQLELTKITYNIDGGEEKVLPATGFAFSRENGTMQKGKTTHYTYHYKLKKHEEVTNTENLTGSVVVKYITTDGQEIKDAVTIQKNVPAGQRLTKSIISGAANLGSKTEITDGTTRYDANTVKEQQIERNGKTYVLTRVLPKDARFQNTDSISGVVKEGLTTIVYEYREVEKAPVTVNYYKDGTTDKLAPSVDKGQSDIGSSYTTEPAVIEPKVEVVDTPEKTVTTITTYTLKEVPADKDGQVPVGGKVVNYYYVENVDVKEVKKQAPVTVNYYKDGTTEKLADSIEQGKKDIGSQYTTESKVIEPKVTVEETPEKTITRTVAYTLKETPSDKDGAVPVNGKVVNYYYIEKVDVKEVAKQAPVTVHYYKDGTTEKLADSIEQGKKDIGSKYTTEAKVIESKVTVEETPEKTITRTVIYELKEVPSDKDGVVPINGKVVTYYYVEKVDVKEVIKQAPVTVNYYKDGTTEKLADSIEQGKKDIGSKYTTEAKVIEPKVVLEDTPEKIITRVTRYELVKVPNDKDGVVPADGKVVNYYYREVVDEVVTMKQAPVTVHYYKDGTTEKLADSIEQGKKDIGSKYTTEAPRIIEEKLSDGSVRKWLLKSAPSNANGNVKAGGTTVIYYYIEFSIPKDAPVVELPEYHPPKEEPKVEIPKEQPKVEIPKEQPKVIPVVKNSEPVIQKKVLPNTGSDTTDTVGLGLGAIAVSAMMMKQRRKLKR